MHRTEKNELCEAAWAVSMLWMPWGSCGPGLRVLMSRAKGEGLSQVGQVSRSSMEHCARRISRPQPGSVETRPSE